MRKAFIPVAVLCAALVTAWLVVGPGLGPDPDAGEAPVGRAAAASGDGSDPKLGGHGGTKAPAEATSYGPGVPVEDAPPWLPTPVDLGEPGQADVFLASLLAKDRVDWKRVGEVLAAASGPFSEATRKRLLEALTGDDRAAASRAVIRMREGSLVAGLLALYDDRRLTDGVRAGVLGVLVELEGAEADRVVEALAERLTHEPRRDRELLNAIALRGGERAATLLVEYLRWSQTTEKPRGFTMPHLDFVRDAAAGSVVLAAIANEADPEVQEALVRMTGQRGALSLVRALVGMDGAELPERVHRARLMSLAEIGGDDAALYLLERGSHSDELAEDAFRALGHLSTAGAAGGAALREALARGIEDLAQADAEREPEAADPSSFPSHARPEEALRTTARTTQLLRLLGRLRDPYAAPLMARCLTAPSPRVRADAVDGLGRLGREARDQVGALVAAYGDSAGNTVLQREIVRALGRVGGGEVLEFLLGLQKGKDLPEELQEVVASALENARRR